MRSEQKNTAAEKLGLAVTHLRPAAVRYLIRTDSHSVLIWRGKEMGLEDSRIEDVAVDRGLVGHSTAAAQARTLSKHAAPSEIDMVWL